MVEIIEYESKYADDFRQLNLEWLDNYHLTEQHDLDVLDHPEETVINKGGYIYLARNDEQIIGSAALLKEHNGIYELAKMTVAPAFRGKGISKILMEKCLDKAREIRAVKIILFSNSQLKTAIALYEKYGFHHVPVTGTSFLTADIKMELSL